MIFSSFDFILFFLALVSLYQFTNTAYQRAMLLLVASLLFYASWQPIYLILLSVSLVINYRFHTRLLKQASRSVLTVAIVVNILVLCWFKYLYFFTTVLDELSCLAGSCSTGYAQHWMRWILPLGISFFTFQMLSAHIDTYRRQWHHRISFFKWCLYISFFPQLIAGPIVRPNEIMEQLNRLQPITGSNLRWGALIFCGGLLKKALFADNLAPLTDSLFDQHQQMDMAYAWIAASSFGLQIYFDFSGYSEMALGLARIFGVILPRNFIYPYVSRSVSEFWQRWHVTLSSWLRDYLYFSLGGSRKGTLNTYLNLMMTMLLGGLWHGAGWTFIVWGALHGSALIIYHMLTPLLKLLPQMVRDSQVYAALGWLATMAVVWFSWVLFRAETLPQAWEIMNAMLGFGGSGDVSIRKYQLITLGMLTLLVLVEPWIVNRFANHGSAWKATSPAFLRGAVYAAFALAVVIFGGNTQKFIYFDF